MALTTREALVPKAVISPRIQATLQQPSSEARLLKSKPLSEAQLLKIRAGNAWIALSPEDQQAWAVLAAKLRRYSPAKAKVVAPTPRSLYIKAALDRWRLDPSLANPLEPPHTPFAGDEIGVFAIQGTKTNAVPAGHIRIASTARNRTGVMTAVLIQKLSGPNRKPSLRHMKTAHFVTFTPGQTVIDLKVEPGHYATAYRFVDTTSLQLSPVLEAGIVSVGIKPRKRKTNPNPPTPNPGLPPVTHAVIDTERFATLHHWPS